MSAARRSSSSSSPASAKSASALQKAWQICNRLAVGAWAGHAAKVRAVPAVTVAIAVTPPDLRGGRQPASQQRPSQPAAPQSSQPAAPQSASSAPASAAPNGA
eukprot:5331915-Prymnesium_polylepis.1